MKSVEWFFGRNDACGEIIIIIVKEKRRRPGPTGAALFPGMVVVVFCFAVDVQSSKGVWWIGKRYRGPIY